MRKHGLTGDNLLSADVITAEGDLIERMIEQYVAVPSPQSHVLLYTLGGAVNRVPDEATAVAYRDARHVLRVVGLDLSTLTVQMTRRLARGLMRLYYPVIEVSHRERIPPSGPVLFVANQCKEQFRSPVWVRFGRPIDVGNLLSEQGGDSRKALRQLTQEIERRLREVVVHVRDGLETRDQYRACLTRPATADRGPSRTRRHLRADARRRVTKMLELASLSSNDVVYDLGSGDGRIVLGAARQYGCRAVGYEINSRLVEQSRESVRAQDLGHLVRIEHAEPTYFPLPFCALRTDGQHPEFYDGD